MGQRVHEKNERWRGSTHNTIDGTNIQSSYRSPCQGYFELSNTRSLPTATKPSFDRNPARGEAVLVTLFFFAAVVCLGGQLSHNGTSRRVAVGVIKQQFSLDVVEAPSFCCCSSSPPTTIPLSSIINRPTNSNANTPSFRIQHQQNYHYHHYQAISTEVGSGPTPLNSHQPPPPWATSIPPTFPTRLTTATARCASRRASDAPYVSLLRAAPRTASRSSSLRYHVHAHLATPPRHSFQPSISGSIST
mgnify:CR=1 FL=1